MTSTSTRRTERSVLTPLPDTQARKTGLKWLSDAQMGRTRVCSGPWDSNCRPEKLWPLNPTGRSCGPCTGQRVGLLGGRGLEARPPGQLGLCAQTLSLGQSLRSGRAPGAGATAKGPLRTQKGPRLSRVPWTGKCGCGQRVQKAGWGTQHREAGRSCPGATQPLVPSRKLSRPFPPEVVHSLPLVTHTGGLSPSAGGNEPEGVLGLACPPSQLDTPC